MLSHKMHSNFHFKKFLQSMSLLTDLTIYSPFISFKLQKGIFFLIFHKDPFSAENGPFLMWFCPVLPRIISGMMNLGCREHRHKDWVHKLWEEQVERRENTWWIPQIKRLIVENQHCLLNISCQETALSTSPTSGVLPRYQNNAQEPRRTKIDLCSLCFARSPTSTASASVFQSD